MDITLEMVLNILSISISLKPNASDAEILTELKKAHPELNQNNLIDHSGSDLISILENLEKNGNVKKDEEIPARYNITLKGIELNNSYTSMLTDGIGKFNDKQIIEKAEWFIETQGKSNITWLVYSHFKIPKDNNNRADNIASQMEQNDKFTLYFLPNDPLHILVKRNSNFGLNENIKATNKSLRKTNRKMMIIAAFTGLFIAGQFLRDIFSDRKPTYIRSEQIKQQLDSLNQSLRGIDSSLSKAVKDSFYAPFHRQK